MPLNRITKKTVISTVVLLLTLLGFISAQQEIIDLKFLKFAQPPATDSDVSRTLQSLVKVRDISETYSTGGLYLMSHYGDREVLFEKENRELINNPMRNQTWRYCSLFSTAGDSLIITGRNWDNQNVGSIIVSLYHPPDGYASISFSRAMDMGFPLNVDLAEVTSTEFGRKLLLAPFYTTDGINEHGLTIAVAGVREVSVKPENGKELLFITFLMRRILDQTKNVEEAVHLAEKYNPFLLDKNSCAGHLLIADSSGRSVILEYVENQWKSIYGPEAWQVLTNKPVYNMSKADLRKKCWRYKSISESLEKAEGNIDWKAGMKILQDVTQKGTTWSVIYSAATRELYFSVYQNWDIIYHLNMP